MRSKLIYRELSAIPDLKVARNAPLKPHNTMRTGGAAEILVIPRSIESLLAALRVAKTRRLRTFVLGNGSKLLFPDRGFRGMVIKLANGLNSIEVKGTRVRAGAGVMLPVLIKKLASMGIGGIEFAYGVPATVGGATAMNFGAFKRSWGDLVMSVKAVDGRHRLRDLPARDLDFGYRRSTFSKGRYLIAEVDLKLKRMPRRVIRKRMREALEWRKAAQPLVVPNSGSIFKNPARHLSGRLIQEAGMMGKRVGDAQVSTKHANFIVNLGNASSRDVVRLMRKVAAAVRRKFSVRLVPEIQIVK